MSPSVTLPAGDVPVTSSTSGLAGHRDAGVRIDMYDRAGTPLDALSGLELAGSLEWVAGAAVKGSGTIFVTDVGQDVDWLNVRLQPVYTVNGVEWKKGMFMPLIPREPHRATGLTRRVQVVDKSHALNRTKFDYTFALPAGTYVTDAVRTLIENEGEDAGAITDSDETLPSQLVWDFGATPLQIINDILEAAGYFSLRVDSNGAFRVEPWVSPAERPSRYTFTDKAGSLYVPDFDRVRDEADVPNKITVRVPGTGDTEAIFGVATNQDPSSRFSYQARGNAWIVDVLDNVEATSEAAANTIARRELISRTNVAAEVALQHAPIEIDVLDVIRFINAGANVDAPHVVNSTSIPIDPTGLASSTVREVVAL